VGKAEAMRRALSLCLIRMNPELYAVLHNKGYLRPDGRTRESKKPGKYRARKGYVYKRR